MERQKHEENRKWMTIEDMKVLVDRLYAEAMRYSTIGQIH